MKFEQSVFSSLYFGNDTVVINHSHYKLPTANIKILTSIVQFKFKVKINSYGVVEPKPIFASNYFEKFRLCPSKEESGSHHILSIFVLQHMDLYDQSNRFENAIQCIKTQCL